MKSKAWRRLLGPDAEIRTDDTPHVELMRNGNGAAQARAIDRWLRAGTGRPVSGLDREPGDQWVSS